MSPGGTRVGDNSKLLILTGVTRGIGQALARRFLASGWVVAGCYHQDEIAAQATRNEFEPFGEKYFLSKCDVTDEKATGAFVEEAVRRYGPPEAAIHNAGFTRDGLILKTTENDWDAVLSVHLGGARNLAKGCLPTMMRSGGGHLIFVSSITATTGAVGQAAYVSAKAAEIGLARSLAREYGSRHVRCNVVLPGFHDTKLSEKMSTEARQTMLLRHVLWEPPSFQETASFFSWLVDTQGVSGQVFNLDSRFPGWL
jgi:3-oxoacyl-[acyl-carrier protein] reductase